MSKQTKILIFVSVVIFSGIGIYGVKVFLRGNIDQIADNKKQATPPIANDSTSDNSPTSEIDNSAIDESANNSNQDQSKDNNNNYLDVSKSDCNDNCKNFTDPDDLKYCQEICGISEIKNDVKNKSVCDPLKDLEKDYCLKDLAVSTKNAAICSEIDDSNVQKVCTNSVTPTSSESQK